MKVELPATVAVATAIAVIIKRQAMLIVAKAKATVIAIAGQLAMLAPSAYWAFDYIKTCQELLGIPYWTGRLLIHLLLLLLLVIQLLLLVRCHN